MNDITTQPAKDPTSMSDNFNPHGSRTGNGVLITRGLRVFTNNLDTGWVVEDRDAERCQSPDQPAAQMVVGGGWFTDHRAGDDFACRNNHWFTVELDDGGAAMMDGERMATVFQGKRA